MCQPKLHIKFCTCHNEPTKIVHNKNSRRYKRQLDQNEYERTILTWRLNQYIGNADISMDGMLMMPSDQLTEELTNAFFLDQLNTKTDLFDFDYSPKEGDNLEISISHAHKAVANKPRANAHGFTSFVYRSGAWVTEQYNCFIDQVEEIKNGTIKVERKD